MGNYTYLPNQEFLDRCTNEDKGVRTRSVCNDHPNGKNGKTITPGQFIPDSIDSYLPSETPQLDKDPPVTDFPTPFQGEESWAKSVPLPNNRNRIMEKLRRQRPLAERTEIPSSILLAEMEQTSPDILIGRGKIRVERMITLSCGPCGLS